MAMHEVSLIENVLALVEQERAHQAFARVNTIRLKVGALGCADPEALRFCFGAVTAGTIAEGSRLEIEIIPGEGWCADCGSTVPLAERYRLDGGELEPAGWFALAHEHSVIGSIPCPASAAFNSASCGS